MKLNIYAISVVALLSINMANATDIQSLLSALDNRPEDKLDIIAEDKSELAQQALNDKLMPKVDLYGGYERYNRPNGLLPVAPNRLTGMVKDQSVAQPFSKRIMREGIKFTWPIFIKSINTLKQKANLLHLATKDKRKLDIYQRQAIVVGAVAQLQYLEALKSALQTKKESILQTKETTNLKVEVGRTPPSALFMLNAHINDLDIAMNDIDQNINMLLSQIESLTNIELKHSVPLSLKKDIEKGDIFALKPLSTKIEASQKDIEVASEAYYPTVVTKGSYTSSEALSYNNDKFMRKNFGSIGIFVSMPLYDNSKKTDTQKAKLAYLENQTIYEQTKHNLTVEAKKLTKEIEFLKDSIVLSKQSVEEQERLLTIAKVALASKVSTQEEYLRYEDALADAKAKLYRFRAKIWQDVARLTVIYGNDLKGVLK